MIGVKPLGANRRASLVGVFRGRRLLSRNAALVTYYTAGHSLAETAEAFGVSRVRVYQVLIELGVPRHPKHIKRNSQGEPA